MKQKIFHLILLFWLYRQVPFSFCSVTLTHLVKYIKWPKFISEFVTFIKADKDYLVFSIFCYTTSLCYGTDFHFHVTISLTECQNCYNVCLISIMTNGYPCPKIVLNITRTPIPAKKSGKVYIILVWDKHLYIYTFKGYVYLHYKNSLYCGSDCICSWLWYIMYKSYNGHKQPSQSEMSASFLVHAYFTVYIYMILSFKQKRNLCDYNF